jgi:hypothetical protein
MLAMIGLAMSGTFANEPLAGDSGRHKMTGGLPACWMLFPGP